MLTLILFLAILSNFATAKVRNITLDDNDPTIVYSGDWLSTPYDNTNAGGTHKVTATTEAFASLTFTGVAVYFFSPLWPFRVTTAVSLDSSSTELLDLRDYDAPLEQDGPESAQSQVVWWVDGLENASHTLVVSVGTGEDLAILDQIVYTVEDSSNSTGSFTMHHGRPSQSRTISMASASSTAASSTSSKSNSKIGLIVTLSVVCSLFGIFCLWFAYWYWQRRKRRLAEGQDSPDAANPEMSEATTRRYPRTTGLNAAGRDRSRSHPSASGSLRSKWRRAPPPPPRSKTRGGGPKSGMRAHKALSTIPESSGDGDTLKPSLSITEVQEREEGSQDSRQSHESATLSSPDSLTNEQRTDADISISPSRPSVRLVADNR